MTKLLNLLPLKTERLIIRETNLNDVNLLLKLDKEDVTQKYLGGIKNKTYEERLFFIENKLLKENNIPLTVALLDETSIGFIYIKILENNICELSYIFDYDYTNKGYCTESCHNIVNALFELGFNKIIADTIEKNISSKKVLEKLGFKIYGTKLINNLKFILYEKTKE